MWKFQALKTLNSFNPNRYSRLKNSFNANRYSRLKNSFNANQYNRLKSKNDRVQQFKIEKKEIFKFLRKIQNRQLRIRKLLNYG